MLSGISVGHFIEVVPETVGQFTGLFDKNGNELYYNSDLVKLPDSKIIWLAVNDSYDIPCFIDYSGNSFAVIQFSDYFLLPTTDSNDFEIIGNIHDNHELLNQ